MWQIQSQLVNKHNFWIIRLIGRFWCNRMFQRCLAILFYNQIQVIGVEYLGLQYIQSGRRVLWNFNSVLEHSGFYLIEYLLISINMEVGYPIPHFAFAQNICVQLVHSYWRKNHGDISINTISIIHDSSYSN